MSGLTQFNFNQNDHANLPANYMEISQSLVRMIAMSKHWSGVIDSFYALKNVNKIAEDYQYAKLVGINDGKETVS